MCMNRGSCGWWQKRRSSSRRWEHRSIPPRPTAPQRSWCKAARSGRCGRFTPGAAKPGAMTAPIRFPPPCPPRSTGISGWERRRKFPMPTGSIIRPTGGGGMTSAAARWGICRSISSIQSLQPLGSRRRPRSSPRARRPPSGRSGCKTKPTSTFPARSSRPAASSSPGMTAARCPTAKTGRWREPMATA